MKILGFEIGRAQRQEAAAGPDFTYNPRGEQRGYGGFYDTVAAWRANINFTNVGSPGYGLANPWEAMGVPAVHLCVDKIAKTCATAPKRIYDVSDPHNARHITGTPLARLLGFQANDYQTAWTFWHLAGTRRPLWGNFYAEIQRDTRTGEAVALWPLLNQDVQPELKAGKKVFRVGGKDLANDEVFHVMDGSFNGIVGVSRIAMHRLAISTSVQMGQFTEAFYRQGAKLQGVLQTDATLGGDAAARISASWTDSYGGPGNSGKIPVLEEGLKFAPFSMPLGDAEFVATHRMQIAQIARLFDIPLHKLAEMDGAKFNNVEQQNLSFVIDCIEPIFTSFEQEAKKLFAPRDRDRLEVRLGTDHLLRGDMESRMKALSAARQWDILNRNEARRDLGYNDIGPEGDKFGISGNANIAAPAPSAATDQAPVNTGDE